MKNLKLISTACLIIIATTACYVRQENNNRRTFTMLNTIRVKGNGNIETEERNLALFNGIRVSSGINVELKQGENQSVFVQADENILQYIITEIKGDVLRIGIEQNITIVNKSVKLMITMKEIKSLQASSSGNLTGVSPIKADMLEIRTSSGGNMDIDVAANKINVKTSSGGNASLRGNSNVLEVDVSSGGNINASQLEAREVNADASSGGNVKIDVTEKLIAKASSGGDISYIGEPKVVDSRSSSGGTIRRR